MAKSKPIPPSLKMLRKLIPEEKIIVLPINRMIIAVPTSGCIATNHNDKN